MAGGVKTKKGEKGVVIAQATFSNGAEKMLENAFSDTNSAVSKQYGVAYKAFEKEATANFQEKYDKLFEEYTNDPERADLEFLVGCMSNAMEGVDPLAEESDIREEYGEDADAILKRIGKTQKELVREFGKLSEKEVAAACAWWDAKDGAREDTEKWVRAKAPEEFKGVAVSEKAWKFGDWRKGAKGIKMSKSEAIGSIKEGLDDVGTEAQQIYLGALLNANREAAQLEASGALQNKYGELTVPGDEEVAQNLGPALLENLRKQAKKQGLPIIFELKGNTISFTLNYTKGAALAKSEFTGEEVGSKRKRPRNPFKSA